LGEGDKERPIGVDKCGNKFVSIGYDGHLLEKPMRCKEVFDLLWGNILTIGSLVEIFQTLRKKEGTPF